MEKLKNAAASYLSKKAANQPTIFRYAKIKVGRTNFPEQVF